MLLCSSDRRHGRSIVRDVVTRHDSKIRRSRSCASSTGPQQRTRSREVVEKVDCNKVEVSRAQLIRPLDHQDIGEHGEMSGTTS